MFSFFVMTGGHSAKSQLFLKVLLHRQFFVQLILHFCRETSLTLLDKLMDVHLAFFLATWEEFEQVSFILRWWPLQIERSSAIVHPAAN